MGSDGTALNFRKLTSGQVVPYRSLGDVAFLKNLSYKVNVKFQSMTLTQGHPGRSAWYSIKLHSI